MKAATLFCLVAVAALAMASAMPFGKFASKYGKQYKTPAERAFREQVYGANMEMVQLWNQKAREMGHEQVYNVTEFSDLTPLEFSQRYMGYKPRSTERPAFSAPTPPEVLPKKVDWRTKGCITPVKNQGQCGSCWAFSATETVESYWNLAGGHKLELLSVQQTVSCDTVDLGCNGGDTPTAYQYMMKAGGVQSQASYPYTSGGGNTGTCDFRKDHIVATISGFTYGAQNGDEDALKISVATKGPQSICVDASTWQFYSGGIIQGNCGQQLDHCVQLTGYDTTGSVPYWEVRNSWAASWGEEGYLRVEIGQNLCGIANEATWVAPGSVPPPPATDDAPPSDDSGSDDLY